MSKKKKYDNEINILKYYYYITEKDGYNFNIALLDCFDEDLTENMRNKIIKAGNKFSREITKVIKKIGKNIK